MIRRSSARMLILGTTLMLLVGILGIWLFFWPSCRFAPGPPGCVRVLFLGNSYTFGNDLPAQFAQLARAGGHPVETSMLAEGGWRLADHAQAPQTLAKLRASPWQYVVLQEQSQIPAIARLRTTTMYPAARVLAKHITTVGATPLFFATWAHRQGWPEQGLSSYGQMQDQITAGYAAIAQELDAPIAPAGEAWRLALRQSPHLELWQPDGSHPTEAGTYLAACVLYASIFRQSPEGLSYTAGLPQATALQLQKIAANVVLGQRSR